MEKRISWLEGFVLFVDHRIGQAEGLSPETRQRLNMRHLTQTYIDQSIDRDVDDWANLRERFQQTFGDLTHAAKEGPESLKSSRGRKRSYSQIIDRASSLQSGQDLDFSNQPTDFDAQMRYSIDGSTNDNHAIHQLGAPPLSTPSLSTPPVRDTTEFHPQDLLALSQPYLHANSRLPSHNFGNTMLPTGTFGNHSEALSSPRMGQTMNNMAWNDLQRGSDDSTRHSGTTKALATGFGPRDPPYLEQTPFNPDTSTFSTSISRQAFDLDYSSNLRLASVPNQTLAYNDLPLRRRELDVEDVQRIGDNAFDSLQIQLPPPELQVHLIGLYLDYMETQLPFVNVVSLRSYITSIANKTPKRLDTSPNRLLILAICAYASCCSSAASQSSAPDNGISLTSITSDSLGEIWAGEARNFLMTSSLRRRCDIETVHGIMILVMRDMGCAQYFQAWLWLGKQYFTSGGSSLTWLVARHCRPNQSRQWASRPPWTEKF